MEEDGAAARMGARQLLQPRETAVGPGRERFPDLGLEGRAAGEDPAGLWPVSAPVRLSGAPQLLRFCIGPHAEVDDERRHTTGALVVATAITEEHRTDRHAGRRREGDRGYGSEAQTAGHGADCS